MQITFADINTMDANCADNRQKGTIECSIFRLFLLEQKISRFEKKNGQLKAKIMTSIKKIWKRLWPSG